MIERRFVPALCDQCGGGLQDTHKDHGACPKCGVEWNAVQRYNGPTIPEPQLSNPQIRASYLNTASLVISSGVFMLDSWGSGS